LNSMDSWYLSRKTIKLKLTQDKTVRAAKQRILLYFASFAGAAGAGFAAPGAAFPASSPSFSFLPFSITSGPAAASPSSTGATSSF